jgi:hypothetical protein
MGLHQAFRFDHESPDEVREFLRTLSGLAALDDRGEFFVFSQLPGQPSFTFDCELVPEGIHSERGGEYFRFLGLFVEALTGKFGPVEVEDL